MTRPLLVLPLAFAFALPAVAQEHQDHALPESGRPAAAQSTDTSVAAPTGADLPVGNEAPPPVPQDHAADGVWGAQAMAPSRGILDNEHGGALNSMIFARTAEYQTSDGEDGYRWDGEAWYGGDVNRLVLKSEGEGGFDEGVDSAEVQALYSRAVGPYTDVQIGLRQDFEPQPRTYMAFGVETLMPYWFDAGASLFISEKGRGLGRIEGEYDFRLFQRLVLEPRVEINFAAKADPAAGIGSGVTDGELGLRLRYEIRREFAPYVGVVYERSFGDTADLARAAGADVEKTSFVAGLRAWY